MDVDQVAENCLLTQIWRFSFSHDVLWLNQWHYFG